MSKQLIANSSEQIAESKNLLSAASITPLNPIKVLLAEDHIIVRKGLRLLLEADNEIEIVGEAKNGREAVTMTKQLRPDIVLMDIAMPVLNGLEAARMILQMSPDSRILILSAHEDDAYLERAMEVGVAGYLIKQSSGGALILAVRTIAGGDSYFSPSIDKCLSRYNRITTRNSMRGRRSARLRARETTVHHLHL